MNDKTLIKIAMFCSFIGLIGLLLIQSSVDVDASEISEVLNKDAGEHVKIIGEINYVKEYAAMYVMKVGDSNSEVEVVVFSKEKLTLEKGDFVEVEGEVEEYKKKKEIIASRIALL